MLNGCHSTRPAFFFTARIALLFLFLFSRRALDFALSPAAALLDSAPRAEDEIASPGVMSLEGATRDMRRSLRTSHFGRFFSYVSAAGLSRSPKQRWEAIHAAIHMLWDGAEGEGAPTVTVTVQQLDQLFSLDPLALQSVLPQLAYYVLAHRGGAVAKEVEAFLLRTCAASPTFGYELYWLLLAQPRRIEGGGSMVVHAGSLASHSSDSGLQPVPAHSGSDDGNRSTSASHFELLDELLTSVESCLENSEGHGADAGVDAAAAGQRAPLTTDRPLSTPPPVALVAAGLSAEPGAAVAEAEAAAAAAGGSSDGDGASSAASPFRRELHLVQTLTIVSDQLRAVPREHRLARLRAALTAINGLLPRVGGVSVPAWRPFVPLAKLDAAPHAIVRFLEGEAFVLSTKERVPYLVFVEVVDADPSTLPPRLLNAAHGGGASGSRLGGGPSRTPRVSLAYDAGQSSIRRISMAVSGAAGHAALFAKRRHFSFERMPSSRRPSRQNNTDMPSPMPSPMISPASGSDLVTDDLVAVSVRSDEAHERSTDLAMAEVGAGRHIRARPRANSDPEVSAEGAGAVSVRVQRGTSAPGGGAAAPPAAPSAPPAADSAHDAEASARLLDSVSEPPTPLRAQHSDDHADADEGSGSAPSSPLADASAESPRASGHVVEAGGSSHVHAEDEDEVEVEEEEIDYSVNEGFGELWAERAERLRRGSPHAALPGWSLHAFIVKSNDELLQEQFAVSLVSEFDRIFGHARLPLRLTPYKILATVRQSCPLSRPANASGTPVPSPCCPPFPCPALRALLSLTQA